MARHPSRRRRRTQDGWIASRDKREGSPCQQDTESQGGEIQIPYLPEEIWCHIHSMMPMRAAARFACVSRAFLHSWRCHPNLTFCASTLGLNKKPYGADMARDFHSKVDQILKRHSGIGVKKLEIYMYESCIGSLESWLQVAVTPGIEELTLAVPIFSKCDFPCSLLSNGNGDSIRYLNLAGCFFRPTDELGWLRSLTDLYLHFVCATGHELERLLCNAFTLKRLVIKYCNEITLLKVPCVLQRIRHLEVFGCIRLRKIDIKVPNISSFCYGDGRANLSLGETLKMEKLHITFQGAVHYARVELPSRMPNLKTATICSSKEMMNTPMLHSKYLHLKKLSIFLRSISFPPAYDYFSLASFFDACPSLEILVLNVSQKEMEHVSIFTDPSTLRRKEHQHHKLRRVKIQGFTSAKSLVELTCHIIENMPSLERLTLEAHQSAYRFYVPAHGCSKCLSLPIGVLVEAQRALLAIRTYIEPKVPSMVKLRVVEPCRRCHVVEL